MRIVVMAVFILMSFSAILNAEPDDQPYLDALKIAELKLAMLNTTGDKDNNDSKAEEIKDDIEGNRDSETNISFKQRLEFRISEDMASSDNCESQHRVDLRYRPTLKGESALSKLRFVSELDVRVAGEYGCCDSTEGEVLVGENFLFLDNDRWNLSLGFRKFTWGKLDKIAVIDRVNPYDMRDFFVWDKNERKLPSFNCALNLLLRDVEVDFIFVPFFTQDKYLFFNSDWAIFGRLKELIEKGSYSQTVKTAVEQIKVADDGDVTKRRLRNAEYNVRIRGQLKDVDFSFYYMYHYNHVPVLGGSKIVKAFLYNPTESNLNALVSQTSSEDRVLRREYNRLNIIGMDFETTFYDWGIRGEFAWFSKMPFLDNHYGLCYKDLLFIGLGADYTFPNDLYMNWQFLEQIVANYIELYGVDRYSHTVVLSLSKSFFDGDLELSIDFVKRFPYDDYLVNPELSYRLTNRTKFIFGGYWFGGSYNSIFGPYTDNDFVYGAFDVRF